jgi:hypothetical protein
MPVSSPVQTELIGIVHEQLRAASITLRPPKGAARGGAGFEAVIVHRPGDRIPGYPCDRGVSGIRRCLASHCGQIALQPIQRRLQIIGRGDRVEHQHPHDREDR